MALADRVGKMFQNITNVAMASGKVGGKIAGPIVKSGLKGAVNLGNKVLDGVEAAAKIDGKEVLKNIGHGAKKVGAATVDNVFTNDASYKTIGKTGAGISKKLNLLDEVAAHTRAAGNIAYKVGRGVDIASFKGPISGKQRTISTRLLKPSDDSLIGLRATGLGATLMIGASAMTGLPRAVQTAVNDRTGYSDGQAVGHAPTGYTPAYQQNAGATGDLVFALNDLRRG